MTETWQRLHPSAQWMFSLQAFVRFLFFWVPASLAIGAGLGTQVGLTEGLIAGGGVLLLQLVLAVVWPLLAFRRWAWILRDEDLLVSHGVLLRELTAIPLHRIQHVDVRQGPLEQWMGLSRVLVYTASGMGADAAIPGLSSEVASGLRDRLVKVRGDDGV